VETVLIIGASGTVGMRLLDEIGRQKLNARMKFVCASRSDMAAKKIQARGFNTSFVNLAEPQTIEAALFGVATVFLLKPYGLNMLNYSKSVVDAASAAGVRSLVNLSAFGPDSSCIDLLTWHRLVDGYIERSGVPFTHLRPAFFMDGLAARIDREAGLVYDLSDSKVVPWVATADIARVATAVISDPQQHAGKAYSLISEMASAPHVAHLLGELLGKQFDAAAMDEEKAVNGLMARGREPVFARAIVEYGKAAAAFPASDAIGNIQAITGHPATRLQEFLTVQFGARISGQTPA
jgi:NAD(P)H dehydrogenase (quinone)